MHVIPTKNAANAYKDMTISSKKTSSHIPRGLPRQQKYDSCQLYNTLAKYITTQSHMLCRIGIFLPVQVKEGHGLQGQSMHAPRVVGIVDFVFLYAQTIWCPKQLVDHICMSDLLDVEPVATPDEVF